MKSSLPTSAMPKGELRFCMNTCRTSAVPSPSASRSRVMRLALGTPAPARFWIMPKACDLIQPTRPPPPVFAPSGLGGLLLSTTSTSPLGRV